MTKLIASTNDKPVKVPQKNIALILQTWAELAGLVEQKAAITKGCYLEWELLIQHVEPDEPPSPKRKGGEFTYSYVAIATVRMAFEAYTARFSNLRQHVSVPVTEVDQITITDDGLFSWHCAEKRLDIGSETIAKLAEAVSKGKLKSGHHYECNRFPRPQ